MEAKQFENMKNEKTLEPGSYSHATMRTRHLLPVFMAALESVDMDGANKLREEYAAVFEMLNAGDEPERLEILNGSWKRFLTSLTLIALRTTISAPIQGTVPILEFGNAKWIDFMKRTKEKTPGQLWKESPLNRAFVTQKGKHCGEIRMGILTAATEFDDELRAKLETMLKSHPQHQTGYFDIELNSAAGAELDFETHCL